MIIQFSIIAQQREFRIALIPGAISVIVFLLLGAGFYSLPAFFVSAFFAGFLSYFLRRKKGKKIWLSKFNRNVQEAKNSKIQLLFIGDSLMERWKFIENIDIWNKYYKPLHAANFGIGGDTTYQILWRIKNGELDNLKPRLIVLLAGTNNISGEESPRNIALSLGDIILEIKNKCPDTKILLLGVFPSGRRPGTMIRKKIIQLNNFLSKMEDISNIFYMDVGDKFLSGDGSISKDIMPDFVHLNSNGYLILGDAIDEKINSLIN